MHDTISPDRIIPLHEVRDPGKLQALTDSMIRNGWQGRPILALDMGHIQAITGSHRIQAARDAELEEIPVYILDTRDHIIGDDGNCVVCGRHCWVSQLWEAEDDERRLMAIGRSDDGCAIEIMRQEIV